MTPTTQSSPVRIHVLGALDSPYVADLQRAALAHGGVQLEVARFGDMLAGLALPSDALPELETLPEAVIVRSMPLGSLEQVIFRMDCLQVWESRGVQVVNPPRSLEIAIDKWLTLHRLHQAGLPIPPTLVCQTRGAAMQAFEALGRDVVVKPLFGGEGRGIVRLQDPDVAWRVLGTLQQISQVMYVQQFCPHFGYDVRVLFVGDQVFAVKRIAVEGPGEEGWRTNLSRGSRAEPHHLSQFELDLAQRSAAAVGGSILGVDLLPCRDGRWVVLEVNAVPGWKGLGKALGVDVAAAVIEHVCRLVRN